MPRPVPTTSVSLLDFAGAKAVKQLDRTNEVIERRRQRRAVSAAPGTQEELFASRVDRGRIAAEPRRVPGYCPDRIANQRKGCIMKKSGVGHDVEGTAGVLAEAVAAARRARSEEHRRGRVALDGPDEEESLVIFNKDQLVRAFEGYGVAAGEDKQSELIAMEEWASRSRSCCICIEFIGRKDKIWSCSQCSVPTHLACIQTWANRLVKFANTQNVSLSGPWHCPSCRHSYSRGSVPSDYFCFCGKELDPRPDPWLLPHSCGDHCEKALTCGHRCKLICHPGRCPPCPLAVNVPCYCGAVREKKRCGMAKFSCGKICGQTLACGHHKCSRACHDGECGRCETKVVCACPCGRKKKLLPCADVADFQCESVCGKPMPCGMHMCEAVCHRPGKCPPCPTEKVCTCGKTRIALKCGGTAAVALLRCEHTCGKMLDCRKHRCVRRCHEGPCSGCTQVTRKTCRCGSMTKEVACSQEMLCERKCNKDRNCGRHQCHRRCCDGKCPPCSAACQRKLDCGVCRCPMVCGHGGFDSLGCELYNCPPCTKQAEVRCFCGETGIMVPCGLPKKPPPCAELCRVPPTCHHESRQPHRCHTGPCPPCDQECTAPLQCGHLCRQNCHDPRPEVDIAPAAWSRRPRERSLEEALSAIMPAPLPLAQVMCPPCGELVERLCIGNHSHGRLPCSANPYHACGDQCQNWLPCGNHRCTKGCHSVLLGRSEEQFEALLDIENSHGEADGDTATVAVGDAAAVVDDSGSNADDLVGQGDGGAAENDENKTDAELQSPLQPPPAVVNSTATLMGIKRKQRAERQTKGAIVKFAPPVREDCGECTRECLRPRPSGCRHPCSWPCHYEACPPCFEDVQVRCYCEQMLLTYACCEVLSWPSGLSREVENPFLRCPFVCHRKHDGCPHMCTAKCHFGACPPCAKHDVAARCRCGMQRKLFPCAEVWRHGEQLVLDCTDECRERAASAKAALAAEQAADSADADANAAALLEPSAPPMELRERRKEKKKQRDEEDQARRLKEEAALRRKACWRRARCGGFVALGILVCVMFVFVMMEARRQNMAWLDEEQRQHYAHRRRS
eukprot:TRINITY_DN37138_c0_g1_i1.p1 TRINITY_DN37138_c0_g1~~TRINITY_DN37138_c0_g1_i1.p1  ORF type:complete len:1075 (+),score=167.67 TRINITY_DN37138_c0_g1_i1:244-3468(+)